MFDIILQEHWEVHYNYCVTIDVSYFSECAKHCSICYNETECFECTQGYFLTEDGECKRKLNEQLIIHGLISIVCYNVNVFALLFSMTHLYDAKTDY